jgi:Spy/CpxP family protein refolding chaperone
MIARAAVIGAVLFGGSAMLGCGGSSANNPSPATATAASSTAMSLDTLGVSPEQQAAVEKIRTELHARMEPARAAEQNMVAVLADGVAAGTLDTVKVDAVVAQLSAAAAVVHDASMDALDTLHGVLTLPQRAALVDKVQAHWAVWQKANADESGQAKPEGGHLAALAADLGLTTDQVDRIRAGLVEGMRAVPRLDPQEIGTHLQAFGDAFRAEKFDAKTLRTANSSNAHMVGWGAAHMAHFVETVSPVLTPDQRAAFAQRLREHATHNASAQANP